MVLVLYDYLKALPGPLRRSPRVRIAGSRLTALEEWRIRHEEEEHAVCVEADLVRRAHARHEPTSPVKAQHGSLLSRTLPYSLVFYGTLRDAPAHRAHSAVGQSKRRAAAQTVARGAINRRGWMGWRDAG
jgi:hypothetical protein